MMLSFTQEETELLIELFNARIEYIRSFPLGSRRIRGYENTRDIIAKNPTYSYRKPQYVRILSCVNEALVQDRGDSELLESVKKHIQFPCNH